MFNTKTDQQILRLALPSIISNVTVPLLGLIDLAIVGHMGSTVYIGAIAVGSMIFNVIYWIFNFLRMGTSGMTSQALGQRNLTTVSHLLLRSLVVALLIALILLLLQRPLQQLALFAMHPSVEIAVLVRTYYNICIWGAPAMLCLYSLTGWFVGMQNTRIPMIVSISQNVINIVASLTLVYAFGMKIEGVALGTLIAQWGGFLLALFLLLHNYSRLSRYLRDENLIRHIFNRREMMKFFSLNRDLFFRTLALVAVNLFFTAAGARQGDLMLAVNTLLMTLFTLYSYIMDGFAFAGEALCGKHWGAHNNAAFCNVTNRLFLWGWIMVVLFTLVYALGGTPFLSLLTSDAHVVSASTTYRWWAVAIPLFGMAAFLYDGIFVGITHSRGMLISTSVATLLFFSIFFALRTLIGNHALWLALLVYLATRGIVQGIIFKRIKHSLT